MNEQLLLESNFFLDKELSDESLYLIHRAYLSQRANYTRLAGSTKTRSEVRGGGRKPWKQKGTGRARAGSSRSPLWRGGGVIFGPKPRIKKNKLNKKEKGLALLTLLEAKKNNIILFEDFSQFSELTKTKDFITSLNKLKIDSTKKIALIDTEPNKNLYLSSRNIKNIQIMNAKTLNIASILNMDYFVTNLETLHLIKKFYKK